ncbi:MAG: EamA family transporter [Dehalococcoidia bacterium]
MSTGVFLLVLGSAVSHATWNFLTKRSTHKTAFFWCFTAVAFALYLPAAVAFGIRDGVSAEGWLRGLGTALLHGVYGLSLSRSYRVGDLSMVYPISRGMGPLLVPVLAVLLLGESVSALAAGGVALIVVGIYALHAESMAPAALARPLRFWDRADSRYALITGALIATYTLWDKAALDHVPPVALNQFAMAGHVLVLAPIALAGGALTARAEWRESRGSVVAAGILSPLAYVLVLVALTASRVSYVAPAREVGIVLGVALGVFLLGEPYGKPRILGSALIATGVILLAVAP